MTFAAPPPPVVVDASFAVEALLEGGPSLERWVEWIRDGRMRLVPAHFWAELANALLRGRRFEPGRAALTVGAAARAGLETADRGLAGVADALDLADRHRLTVYDSLYLQLAADVGGELATLDRDLVRAARAEGVEVVAPSVDGDAAPPPWRRALRPGRTAAPPGGHRSSAHGSCSPGPRYRDRSPLGPIAPTPPIRRHSDSFPDRTPVVALPSGFDRAGRHGHPPRGRRTYMTGRGMNTTAATHGHPRRQRRLATLLGLALVSGSLGAGALSLALFTDSQAVTGNAFATGTIDISTTPATALFSVPTMMPGDTSSQSIVVNNAGTGALRYAISTAIVSGPDARRPAPAGRLRGRDLHRHAPLQRGARQRRARQQRAGCAGRATARWPGGANETSVLQGDPAARDRELRSRTPRPT